MTKTADPTPVDQPLTLQTIRGARGRLAMLLTLTEKTSDAELAELGVEREEVESLIREAQQAQGAIPETSCKAMYAAGFSRMVTKELALVAHHRAMLAFHAAAPIIGARLMAKADDYNAPGSTRVLLEIAKGIGLLQPAEPVSQKSRMAMLDLDELRDRAKQEPGALKDEILRHSA